MSGFYQLGFTGRRDEPIDEQKTQLRRVISLLQETYPNVVLHHGDCVGADAFAHEVGREFQCHIVIHPPTDTKYRAFCSGDHIHRPLTHMKRNTDIVRNSNHLLAMPRQNEEVIRSGTWATIRRARKKGIPITIIPPKEDVFLE